MDGFIKLAAYQSPNKINTHGNKIENESISSSTIPHRLLNMHKDINQMVFPIQHLTHILRSYAFNYAKIGTKNSATMQVRQL